MSKKKWLIVIVGGLACAAALGVALIVGFLYLGGGRVNPLLPVYTHDQTASTHPGYRRTTITSGTAVYVNDYEDYALQLQNPEPTQVVGRSQFGGGKICAIPGEDPAAYLAADVGSEMPAYEVFRNSHVPPFDWRQARFQAMEYTGVIGVTAHKRTTDAALIEDVVRTLREGTPVTLPSVAAYSTNLNGVWLFTDELPGMVFCPYAYRDPAGPVYLAENIVIEYTSSNQTVEARWIPAGEMFAKWLQTR